MKILVTGATGLLGGRLVPYLKSEGHEVVAQGFSQSADFNIDLCLSNETYEFLQELKPDLIIHLVCLSNVDLCEKDKNLAYRLNVLTTENIVYWIESNRDSKLVYVSTDHVYDGKNIHLENEVTIKNTYAFSKYCAEIVATKVNALVLRVNFFGKSNTSGRSSFSDWVISALKNNDEIVLLTDVYVNPLSIDTLQKMILMSSLSDKAGIYNLGSKGGISKRDFAHLVASRLNLNLANAKDGVQSDLNLTALRPSNMVMNVTKFEETFNVKLPTIESEILNAEL